MSVPSLKFPALLSALVGGLLGCGPAGQAQVPDRGPLPTVPMAAAAVPPDTRVLVDQFGYRPGDPKVAVIRNPRRGFDAHQPFEPGALYQLREAHSGEIRFSGKPVPWQDGAVQASSGDAGWWFDFSTVAQPGSYYVFDPGHELRSAVFRIDPQPYREPLRAAVRAFYYQRSAMVKTTPYAEPCWTDDAAYVGPGQDLEARDLQRPRDPAGIRDLSGGWFDAGDTNKYVTFAAGAVHRLLSAYQDHPAVFTDDFGIPESGNGIPDLLDEIKWEIDWLEKMQNADGSVALKVGVRKYAARGGRPSEDRLPRYYIHSCTSATVTAAGMYAHAALLFRQHEALRIQAGRLLERAERAFAAYAAAPAVQTDCDQGQIKAGDADMSAQDQSAAAVTAAVYLFAATGAERYRAFVEDHYRSTWPYRDVGWTRYDSQQGEALLYYASLPNAGRKLAEAIRKAKLDDAEAGHGIYRDDGDDLYRNHLHDDQYHWGSLAVRANYGSSNLDMLVHALDTPRHSDYAARALDTLHYFHGVNPLGQVYLTNMNRLGATRSLNRMLHFWFDPGTPWGDAAADSCGPVPGFVPGGPNANAVADGVPADVVPPADQPAQKAYRDWNLPAQAAWAVTEPSIVYQAAYVKLLAGLVAPAETAP